MLLATLSAFAADPVPTLDFQTWTLPNGLEVIYAQDDRVPLVAVDLWYHVGAKNEVPGKSGFAHLFEHIMFQGSRNVPEDQYFPILEGAGAPEVNGTTSFDRTNYFETMPSAQLELALWLESDRMGFLLDTLTQERLTNQIAVVRKERQQSRENVPYGPAEERYIQLLYPAPHPYNGSIIGSHADLEAATLDDVKAFFRTYYAPNNASLAIVGDADINTVKPLVEKYFGSIPRGAEVPALNVTTAPLVGEQRVQMTDEVELPKVYVGWLTPKAYEKGDADLSLAGMVLSDGKSSRLYTELVEKQQIASEVTAYQYSLQLGSWFGLELVGKAGTDPAKLEAAAWAEIQKLQTTAPTQAEIDEARRGWEANMLRGLEKFGGFGGRADVLNHYNHFLGDPGGLPKEFEMMRAVTPASMQAALQQWLKADNRVVVEVRPVGGAK
jgi:zinc protease